MLDLAPFALVVATALISGSGGYIGNGYKARSSARTVARLVHAELVQNAAPVLYYRETGRLLGSPIRRVAWDAGSESLARLRAPETFTSISEGYQALDGIVLIANATPDGELSDELHRLCEAAIGRLTLAVTAAGRLAGIHDETLELEASSLAPRAALPSADSSVRSAFLDFITIGPVLADRIRGAAAVGAAAGAAGGDAETGRPVSPQVHHAWPDRVLAGHPRRLILDAHHAMDGQAETIARREGEPDTGDVAVDEAYEALGVCYDFFYRILHRDSYDDRNAELHFVVHFGSAFNNLFWDGRRVVAGDGDGIIFDRFTRSLDIIAHDFAVGCITMIRPLDQRNQAGAVFQSVSDVFGVLTAQYRNGESADQADWLLGAHSMIPRPGVRALRSMIDPGSAFADGVLGTDQQVGHFKDLVRTEDDNGGVHLNSGIGNRAFALAARELGGYAWEGVGQIWWQALRDSRLTDRSGYQAFAGATIRAAHDHAALVTDAWRQVGVSARP